MVTVMKRMLETRIAYLLAILWLVTLTLHTFESKLFPVITDFTVTTLEVKDDKVIATGYMRKARECLFVGVSAYTHNGDSKVTVPLLFQDNSVDQTKNRPIGSQPWGPWQMTIATSNVSSITLDAVHRCHPFWLTTTPLTTLPVSAKLV